jgi:hypothetical protein
MTTYRKCPHCGSRYRVSPKPKRVCDVNDMSREAFRATSWLHFWECEGCPREWRGTTFGLVYGDGLVARDIPL